MSWQKVNSKVDYGIFKIVSKSIRPSITLDSKRELLIFRTGALEIEKSVAPPLFLKIEFLMKTAPADLISNAGVEWDTLVVRNSSITD